MTVKDFTLSERQLDKHVKNGHTLVIFGLRQRLVQHQRKRLDRLSDFQAEKVHGASKVLHAGLLALLGARFARELHAAGRRQLLASH